MANWTENDVRAVGSSTEGDGDGVRPLNWPVLFLFGVVVLTIVGNVLVCVAVCRNRKLQNKFNFFLVSLAVSDTLSAILVMPLSIIRTFMERLSVPKLLCVTWYSLDVLFTSSTICHLCMTSIDRYVSLRSPLRHRSQTQNKRCTAVKIAVVWTISVCISGPLFVLSMLHQPTMRVRSVEDDDGDLDLDLDLDHDLVVQYKGCGPETQTFVLVATVFSFYVPLMIMTVMYALTVRALKRQLREQRCLTVNNSSSITSNSSCFREDQHHHQHQQQQHQHHQQQQQQLCSPSTPKDALPSSPLPLSCSNWSLYQDQYHHHLVAPGPVSPSTAPDGVVTPMTVTSSFSTTFSCSPCINRHRCCSKTSDLSRLGPFTPDGAKQSLDVPPHPQSGPHLSSPMTTTPSTAESSIGLSRLQRAASSRGRRHGLEVPVNSVCISSPRSSSRVAASGLDRGRRAVLVLGILFAVFVVFYLPFFGVYVINATCIGCRRYISDRILTAFEWLQYSGSMVNPFVYHAFNPDFQRAFHKLLRCRRS